MKKDNQQDGSMILILVLFCILSLTSIYSSQHTGEYGNQNFALKQGINYIIGFCLLYVISKIDRDKFEQLAWPLYAVLFIMIILLRFAPDSIAPMVLGAKRWFEIPFIGSIQPSEFFKIALILLTARMINKHNMTYPSRTITSDIKIVLKVLLVSIPPALLVYQQPDTGMVFLYFIALGSMLFLSGVNWKLVFVSVAFPLLIIGALVYLYYVYPNILYKQLIPLLSPHQQDRIIGWLNPDQNGDQAYQTQQSLLAVGSGGIEGKGIGHGTVYIPEKHTDFIFATIGEEGGFLGASFVITLFMLLAYRIIMIGATSGSFFGALICAGTVISLSAQVFQNIGMIVGLMPVKGISLPFLTYGGSSLFSQMILLGIILSIRRADKKYMFKTEDQYPIDDVS